MLEVSLHNLEVSRVNEIVVVLGFAAQRILPLLEGRERVRVVINPRFREGMSTSIYYGLRAIDPKSKGVLIALADQPFIPPEVIDLLIEGFAKREKGIVLPLYQGRRGHPVILDRARYGGKLLELRGDVGAREIVAAHPEDVMEVEVTSPGVVMDIDDWEGYKMIQEE